MVRPRLPARPLARTPRTTVARRSGAIARAICAARRDVAAATHPPPTDTDRRRSTTDRADRRNRGLLRRRARRIALLIRGAGHRRRYRAEVRAVMRMQGCWGAAYALLAELRPATLPSRFPGHRCPVRRSRRGGRDGRHRIRRRVDEARLPERRRDRAGTNLALTSVIFTILAIGVSTRVISRTVGPQCEAAGRRARASLSGSARRRPNAKIQ
jgi:hypothetical protein